MQLKTQKTQALLIEMEPLGGLVSLGQTLVQMLKTVIEM
jgi:hypothetical protein